MDNSPIQAALQQTQQPQLDQAQQTNPLQALRKRQAQFDQAAPDQAAISAAINTLKPTSTDPAAKVGSALNTNNYSGLCLQYVDDRTGNTNRQPTAYADYQARQQAGVVQTSGTPPKGARVYFAPTPDNPAGHVGLSNGDSSFTGATSNQGIKTFKIGDWERYANQQYIGWSK